MAVSQAPCWCFSCLGPGCSVSPRITVCSWGRRSASQGLLRATAGWSLESSHLPCCNPVLPGKTSSPSKDLGLGAAEPGLMHGVKWHKRTGRAQAHQGHMCQEQDTECQSPSLRAECTGCRNIHQDSMSKPFPHWAGVTCAPPVPPPVPTLQPGPTPPPPHQPQVRGILQTKMH